MATNRFTLPNGLRVVHRLDVSTSMVAVNVLYNVGARDEDERTRGLAHLCEHMMFTGSPGVPDFEAALQDVGAVNNAWTSNDFTNYHEFAPAAGLETLLRVESDRMRAITASDRSFANQLSVVIEEFKQTCLNQPYGDLQHHLRPAVYGHGHPYSVPVIGSSIDVLRALTPDDIRLWHSTFYSPANAVLAVCGNVDFDTARTLVERWFGPVPARHHLHVRPVVKIDRDSCPASPVTVHGNVPQTIIAMAWPMDTYGTAAWYGADSLSDVLSSGRSSRFFRRINMQSQLIVDADASITGEEGNGMFLVTARLADESPGAVEQAIDTLLTQTRALCGDEPATAEELQRAKNKYRSRFLFSNIDCASRAAALALAEMHGEEFETQTERYAALTTDTLLETARTLFTPDPAILVYRPDNPQPLQP